MFFMVFGLSAYFISNVYVKYTATPMIISLNSMSTDITTLPFPGNLDYYAQIHMWPNIAIESISAVTVCNMNQAVKSVVRSIPTNSDEYSMVQSLCTNAVDENVTNSKNGKWAEFQKLIKKVKAPLSTESE